MNEMRKLMEAIEQINETYVPVNQTDPHVAMAIRDGAIILDADRPDSGRIVDYTNKHVQNAIASGKQLVDLEFMNDEDIRILDMAGVSDVYDQNLGAQDLVIWLGGYGGIVEASKLIEDFDDEEHYSIKYAEVEKFKGRKIIITDLYDGDVYGILDTKHGPRFMISAPLWRGDVGPENVTYDEIQVTSPTFDINAKDEEFLQQWYMESISESIEEANQGGKTEHSGAKKGEGAYYGRKKDAKKDSNKNRRGADKAESNVDETIEIIGEAASSQQWEIAINNLIEKGGQLFKAGRQADEGKIWNWVSSELHGMLDFQPEGMGESVELGEGRQFVSAGAMVMWMLGSLERMQLDYGHAGDGEEAYHEVMEDINNLIQEMKDAEIKKSRPAPRLPRRPFSSRI